MKLSACTLLGGRSAVASSSRRRSDAADGCTGAGEGPPRPLLLLKLAPASAPESGTVAGSGPGSGSRSAEYAAGSERADSGTGDTGDAASSLQQGAVGCCWN